MHTRQASYILMACLHKMACMLPAPGRRLTLFDSINVNLSVRSRKLSGSHYTALTTFARAVNKLASRVAYAWYTSTLVHFCTVPLVYFLAERHTSRF